MGKSTWIFRHRVLRWVVGILISLGLIVMALFIWFNVSPWPGAMIIRWEFTQNGAKTTAALSKHQPTDTISVISDQSYIPGDADALLDVYTPKSAADAGMQLPVIVWTHGGAWLSGDKVDAAPYFKLLAQAGYTVIAPDYTLAPEKSYPTQIHQLNAAHAYILANAARLHADTTKIILAGDSAGSQLSAQMAALATSPEYAREVGITPALTRANLKAVVLTCGIYKMEELARPTPDLSKLLAWGDNVTVWAYSGTNDFSKPVIKQMSPYYHVTKDFPTTFITGGNGDLLTDTQSKPLADKLESLGVGVTRLFYAPDHTPQLPHEYQFNLDNADGQQALQEILTFAAKQTQ
jgi:acetyl esterase